MILFSIALQLLLIALIICYLFFKAVCPGNRLGYVARRAGEPMSPQDSCTVRGRHARRQVVLLSVNFVILMLHDPPRPRPAQPRGCCREDIEANATANPTLQNFRGLSWGVEVLSRAEGVRAAKTHQRRQGVRGGGLGLGLVGWVVWRGQEVGRLLCATHAPTARGLAD